MKFPDNITIISDEVSQDLPVISAFVREFRLPGIELRSLNGRAFKDLTPSDIAEVNTASRAEGWRVVGCATPVFKCDLDDTTAIAAHRDIFKRSLEVAHELNAGLLRVFTFLRTPHPAEPAKQQRVIEHLHGLVALAAGSGIRLGVENEHSCLAATADETLAILAPLPADRVGAIWDPCNVLYRPRHPRRPRPPRPPPLPSPRQRRRPPHGPHVRLRAHRRRHARRSRRSQLDRPPPRPPHDRLLRPPLARDPLAPREN